MVDLVNYNKISDDIITKNPPPELCLYKQYNSFNIHKNISLIRSYTTLQSTVISFCKTRMFNF